MGFDFDRKNLLIDRTKILFAFIYKQSILTNNGCNTTFTVMVTVNKYDHICIAYAVKSKIISVKKLPPVGIEPGTSCDPL